MATVTEPIMTDATGQEIVDKLGELASAVKPNASNIPLTPPSGMTATNVQDGISELKQSLSDLETLEKTASGAIASFDDGSDLPMPKLEVAIEPQQDLHGYDSPWVGGSGKNKLPMTVESIKSKNTAGTWNNNVYTKNDMSFEILTDGANNVTGIKVNGTKNVSSPVYFTIGSFDFAANESYKVNGGVDLPSPIPVYFAVNGGVVVASSADYTQTFTSDTTKDVIIVVERTQQINNVIFHPMIRLSTEQDSSFAPYSNICPISGWSEANVVVSPTTDAEDGTTYTIQFKDGSNPLTVYGGTLDVVNGELVVTYGYISSYNGETLPSTWISDRDVYAEGTTPTTGAEVVYELATPITYQLTPTQVKSLLGVNKIFADVGNIELTFFTNNPLTQTVYDMVKIFVEQST